jgi:hypothetical protein
MQRRKQQFSVAKPAGFKLRMAPLPCMPNSGGLNTCPLCTAAAAQKFSTFALRALRRVFEWRVCAFGRRRLPCCCLFKLRPSFTHRPPDHTPPLFNLPEAPWGGITSPWFCRRFFTNDLLPNNCVLIESACVYPTSIHE